jgi:hypothetical protein
MSIQSAAGAVISIGTTAVHASQANYEADTFTPIGSLESIGEFGDEAAEVTFTGLSDARVQKFKGSRNAGNISVSYGLDDTDGGQIKMINAEDDDSGVYNFKVQYQGGQIRYFSGQVASLKEGAGSGPDAMLMINAEVRINTKILRAV